MFQLILIIVFIAIGAGLAWFLLYNDRGEKEPIDALWLAVGMGIAGALAASFIESRTINTDNLLAGIPHGTMLATAMAVGLIEELCKFVPLAAYIYKQRYFNEHTDGVIYFALAGLGFGLPENILYTLQYGSKTGLVRLALTPLFHSATTGMIGYFLIKRKLARKKVIAVILPLTVAVVAHGLYDFGLAVGTGLYALIALLITLGLSAGLFVLFLKATEQDQDAGISSSGHNDFCRACGKPNPDHYLYCVHCGKNA
jgi:RsiW-degrading membrane proteinase PrsW (M82 family)